MSLLLPCPDCGRTYRRAQHLRHVDQYDQVTYQCPHCYAITGRRIPDAA